MKERSFGLDIVRCTATFFVIAVHFFKNIGFYSHTVIGEGMFGSLFLRWLFYTSVPLFILLTGYLQRTKELSKKYYKGIIHILISYVFISIICLLFRKFYLGQDVNLLFSVITIGNFSANGYSWYIEMYIGLFLLIPFLNILYENLNTKKNKQYLILCLLIIISFSPLINFIRVGEYNLEIIPNFWNEIYPLVYYFIGCYISEYKPKIKKIKWSLICFFIILTQTVITFIYNYNILFIASFFGGYNSLTIVIISTLIFLLLYDIKCNKKPIKKIIKSISIVLLDMYLFSWIVDRVVYPYVLNYIHVPLDYLKYFPITVLIVFIISYILANIKKLLFWLTQKITVQIVRIFKKDKMISPS